MESIKPDIKWILGICLFITFSLVHADVYKWVDKDGHTHYSEKPQGDNAVSIQLEKNPGTDHDTKSRNQELQKLLDVYDQEQDVKQEEMEKQQKESADQQEKCHLLQDRINKLTNGGIIYTIDDKGNRKYLSDAEITSRLDELEKAKQKYCK